MRIISILLLCLLVVSAASAELFVTANPLGQGRWGGLLGYMSASNLGGVSGMGAGMIGGYAGYGITDSLDAFLKAGSLNVTGLPAGVTSSSTIIGLALKYAILKEGADMPVSLAAGLGYQSWNTTASAGAGGNSTTSDLGAGVVVSKVMAPFIPYGGFQYKNLTTAGVTTTSMELTLGSAVAWSEQGAVFVEYTSQSQSAAGANWSQSQIGAGVGYKI